MCHVSWAFQGKGLGIPSPLLGVPCVVFSTMRSYLCADLSTSNFESLCVLQFVGLRHHGFWLQCWALAGVSPLRVVALLRHGRICGLDCAVVADSAALPIFAPTTVLLQFVRWHCSSPVAQCVSLVPALVFRLSSFF